jgi:predicted metal-dependent phosphoesterase TrpH
MPEEVVAAAAAAGVELLALTDHDTVDGVGEAARAAERVGIRLVSGVEISATDEPTGRDLHILGYVLDALDPGLLRWLERSRSARRRRATAMTDALRELGFELDQAALEERIARGRSIGRPHIAQAVMAVQANAPRLAAEGIDDPSGFLEAYLVPGKAAFRPRESPTADAAIQAIHEAGGVAVWAHPFWDVSDPGAVGTMIDRLAAGGLDGVECFYITHTRVQSELLADRCGRLGLLTTGSADFHGPEHRLFSRFRAFSTYGRVAVLGPIAAG